MLALVWVGSGITVLGVIALGWCGLKAARARDAGLSDKDLRSALQRIMVLNLGALAVSGLGLMMVVTGLLLS